jgi:hypothetical protein
MELFDQFIQTRVYLKGVSPKTRGALPSLVNSRPHCLGIDCDLTKPCRHLPFDNHVDNLSGSKLSEVLHVRADVRPPKGSYATTLDGDILGDL